jgi:hypothetical protein
LALWSAFGQGGNAARARAIFRGYPIGAADDDVENLAAPGRASKQGISRDPTGSSIQIFKLPLASYMENGERRRLRPASCSRG